MDLKRFFTFSNIYIKRPAGTGGNGKMGGNVRKTMKKKDFEAFFARIHAWRAVNPCIMRWRLNSSDLLISNKP